MKRLLGLLAVSVLLLTSGAWQVQIPLQQHPANDNPSTKKGRSAARTLTGKVLDKGDNPIQDAVVYLKNQKTLQVRSFYSQPDGAYRFPQLDRNIDYEVYAEKDGKRSDSKTVSQFDDRSSPNINLRIDLNKDVNK